MKILVVYFSKTGHTHQVAKVLASKLQADLDQITEVKPQSMPMVWLKSTRQAMQQKTCDISFQKWPQEYDLVILGGPVWAWNLIAPLRAYLTQTASQIKQFAFFVTYGGQAGKTWEQVAEFKQPLATMAIVDKQVKQNDFEPDLNDFIHKLDLHNNETEYN